MYLVNYLYLRIKTKRKKKKNKMDYLNKLKEKLNNKIIVIFIISVVATLFFCFPYLNKQTIEGHDLDYHLTRIQQINEGIRNGSIPVVIHSSAINGAGYANSLFYPELFLYIPAIFMLVGITTVTSYKIFILLITWFTFISMYICAKKISKSNHIAMISTFLYTFGLYRIVDIYTRAALGEVLSFIFIPVIILGCYELFFECKKEKWWIIPIGIFGLVNSHIITFVFAVGIILFFMILNIKKFIKDRKVLLNIFLAGGISILLTLGMFIPMFEQTTNSEYKVFKNENEWELEDRTLLLTQVFLDDYINLEKVENPIEDRMNLSVGIMILILPIFMLICKSKNEEKKFINQLFILGLLTTFSVTCLFPWKYLHILNFIQIPWRLNLIITACFSIVGAYAFYYTLKQNKNEFTIMVLIGIILVSSRYLNGIKYSPYLNGEMEYDNVGAGEYLPKEFSFDDLYKKLDAYDINNKSKKYEYIKEYNKIDVKIEDGTNSGKINIPLIYYKGYVAELRKEDGSIEKLQLEKNMGNGQIIVSSDKAIKGDIIVQYKMTLIQIISYLISTITAIFVIVKIVMYYLNKIKENKNKTVKK